MILVQLLLVTSKLVSPHHPIPHHLSYFTGVVPWGSFSNKPQPNSKFVSLRSGFPTGPVWYLSGMINICLTCPITAIKPILSHQNDPCLPLLALSDGKPLTTKSLIQCIRLLIIKVERKHKLGLQYDNFSGYSLRRGGATSLYAAGMSETTIKTMGRWRSYCFRLYIETPLYVLKEAQVSMSSLLSRPQQVLNTPAFWDIESPPII